ncbi:lysozyme inhibitor [Bartonella apis]|uniref:lysozyme inhibitor n=1 Tax=Bartonella apis TaxID=1686310 RepID=UPI003999290D
MLKTIFVMVALFLAFPFIAANAQDPSVHNETYICERGVSLQVVFIKDKERDYAIVAIDGKMVAMREEPKNPDKLSPGKLFIAVDEQDNYRLHIKSNEAVVTYKDNEQSKTDKVVLQSCQADIEED